MTDTELDPADAMPAQQRDWLEGTASRTAARRGEVQAQAAGAIASVSAPAIGCLSDHGGEARVSLRAGGIAHVAMPGLDWVATLHAGDGWGTAVVSPRILPAGAAAGRAEPDSGREPYGAATIAATQYVVRPSPAALPPAGFFRAVTGALLETHPHWEPGHAQAQAERIWKDMCELP